MAIWTKNCEGMAIEWGDWSGKNSKIKVPTLAEYLKRNEKEFKTKKKNGSTKG